jgi:hypothetical protein
MSIFFLQLPRLSYAQVVLPFFRTMLAGGVLVILALLAGFVVPAPSTLARPVAPARGPLIEAAQHPEWKQFLVQTAYRRADEVGRLRELPNAPTIVPVPAPIKPVQVAELPPPRIVIAPEDVTGSIDDSDPGVMPVDIGEASATELPVQQFDLPMPIERPETLKRNQSQRKAPARHMAKRVKPAPAKPEPDFLTRLFGDNSAAPATAGPR